MLGEHTFPLAERFRALALTRLYEDLEPLGLVVLALSAKA
jgi:hypothetical protein